MAGDLSKKLGWSYNKGVKQIDSKSRPKRKHTRFDAEPSASAELSFGNALLPKIAGLVMTEAFGGCSVVVKRIEGVTLGTRLNIRVGKLSPMLAKVVWVKEVDSSLSCLGIEYLE